MRRNITVARILLIFSIANVVLAAPASVRQRGLVTDGSDDEPTEEQAQAGSVHQDGVVPAALPPSEAGSLPAGSKQDGKLASSGGPSFQYLESYFDSPSAAGSEQDGKLASSDGPLYQHLESYFDLPSAAGSLYASPAESLYASPAGSEHDGKLASSDGPLYQHLESYFDLPSAPGSLYASAAGSEQDWRVASLGGPAHQGLVPQPSPPHLLSGWSPDHDSALDSPSGLHQDSVPVSGAPPSHGGLPQVLGGLQLKDGPVQSSLHPDWRPTANWEVGESSSAHTVSGAPESLPPKSGAQPWDEDLLGWHDLNPATDIDQASTGGESHGSAWSEVEADVADEAAHLHRSFERSPERDHGHRFSWGVRFCSHPSLSSRHLNQVTNL
jgi:hypothetical protein